MQVFRSGQTLLEAVLKTTQSLGFVPTMGALHKGHLSLIDRALKDNCCVITSIFVNPTQFDNPDDFENYPRTLEQDIAKLSKYDEILVYVPENSDVYEADVVTENYDFGTLDKVMEGAFRKNHFDGVAGVIEKLFTLIKPDKAYFGEKDFQQLQIVRQLVKDRNWPIEIVGCPVVREADGLAMSSRNRLLNANQRKAASIIYKTLLDVQSNFGKYEIDTLNQIVRQVFEKQPLFKLEYFCIVESTSLECFTSIEKNENYRAFIAVKANEVRLIDNIELYTISSFTPCK